MNQETIKGIIRLVAKIVVALSCVVFIACLGVLIAGNMNLAPTLPKGSEAVWVAASSVVGAVVACFGTWCADSEQGPFARSVE